MTTRSTLPILFVLLAACGSAETAERAPRAAEPPATEPAAPAPAEPAATPVAAPAAPAPSPAAAPAPGDPATLTVTAATFTHGVESRRPVDEVRTFTVGERATVHLVVANLGAPREVTVEWTRGETVLGRTSLEVGTSRAWRTWATRRVTARDASTGVHARILDADGSVLQELDADVAAAPITPSA